MPAPRIFLVLDDPALADRLVAALHQKGLDATAFQGSAAALAACDAAKPGALVTGQLLAGIDGIALTKQVKSVHRIPVVLISAMSTTAGIQDARRASGADAVLPRSFKPDALLDAIRRVLGIAVKPATGPRKIVESFRKAPPPTGTAAPVPPAPAGPATPTTPVTPVDPAWILGRAALDGVTGALRFVNKGVERTIYLSGGRPVIATSNVPEERLGAVLVRKEKITPGELNEALNYAAKKNLRLLQILVTMGVLTEKEKVEEVAEHYAERTLALFAWVEASIEFTSRPAPVEDVTVQLPAERLIAEGVRRHYDLPRLQALLPGDRVLSPAADLSTRAMMLSLTEAELAPLPLVNGVRTVADVCAAASQAQAPFRMEGFTVEITTGTPSLVDSLRALYASLCLDLVV